MKNSFLFSKQFFIKVIMFFMITANVIIVSASDRTDAIALQDKCDKGAVILEVPVKNFGSEKELNDFENALKKIKLGKVKLTQSKYLEAQAFFNEYLEIEYDIYKRLGKEYIKRAEQINDDSAVDLIDYIEQSQVAKNFRSASMYIDNAKKFYNTKHYSKVYGQCRLAKKVLFENYKIAGQTLPDEYKKDDADVKNKIY